MVHALSPAHSSLLKHAPPAATAPTNTESHSAWRSHIDARSAARQRRAAGSSKRRRPAASEAAVRRRVESPGSTSARATQRAYSPRYARSAATGASAAHANIDAHSTLAWYARNCVAVSVAGSCVGIGCVVALAGGVAGSLEHPRASVPRVLEARGLDVTPGMIARLRGVDDHRTADILEVILREEVAHVAAGSRWFTWCCEREGREPRATFNDLLREHARGVLRGPFNEAARLQAGFSVGELAWIREQAA